MRRQIKKTPIIQDKYIKPFIFKLNSDATTKNVTINGGYNDNIATNIF